MDIHSLRCKSHQHRDRGGDGYRDQGNLQFKNHIRDLFGALQTLRERIRDHSTGRVYGTQQRQRDCLPLLRRHHSLHPVGFDRHKTLPDFLPSLLGSGARRKKRRLRNQGPLTHRRATRPDGETLPPRFARPGLPAHNLRMRVRQALPGTADGHRGDTLDER